MILRRHQPDPIDRLSRLIWSALTHRSWHRTKLVVPHIIVNPVAGVTSRRGRMTERIVAAERFVEGIRGPERPTGKPMLSLTQAEGEARLLCEEAAAIARSDQDAIHVIVSVGGDGTHLEVAHGLICDGVPRNALLIRLPFGTGNDGADGPELDAVVNTIVYSRQTRRMPIVWIKPNGKPAMPAVNVASIGLDAYISALSNRLKQTFPGDVYKLVTNVAVLFYEPPFRKGPIRLTLWGRDGSKSEIVGRQVLTVFGASGYRTYGSGMWVLPTPRNVCTIRHVNLIGKLRLKREFFSGAHIYRPATTILDAERMDVDFDGPLPLQRDGEGHWLDPQDFPVSFVRSKAVLPVLRPPATRNEMWLRKTARQAIDQIQERTPGNR